MTSNREKVLDYLDSIFFRLEGGKIVEHWDVMQEEVPADRTISGNPMFPVG
jgi:predicted SnoaL-like aldol condensation-catalyzing enzyme